MSVRATRGSRVNEGKRIPRRPLAVAILLGGVGLAPVVGLYFWFRARATHRGAAGPVIARTAIPELPPRPR
jgi:hypothetical protein